jgi:hypothetical protein
MSREGTQKERTRSDGTRSDGREDFDVDDFDGGNEKRRSRNKRMNVSNRTSWSGLAKRTYNVLFSSSSGRSEGSSAKLAVAMLAGAFLAGLLPLPFTWLLGIGLGAGVGGWAEEGSALAATVIGGILGFLGGLALAPALFGLGIFLTLIVAVVGAVVGGVGFLVGDGTI